ncbi:Type II secretion system protein D precursor [compost metagenome]
MMQLGRLAGGVVLAVVVGGCAGELYSREGTRLISEGKYDEGLAKLEQATKDSPTNAKYRVDLITHRNDYIYRLFNSADAERLAGQWETSEANYRQILKIEPNNGRALQGLASIERERRYVPIIAQAQDALKKGEPDRAMSLLKPILAEAPSHVEAVLLKRQIEEQQVKEQITEPILQSADSKPISLEFRDANLKMVFEALARSTGVNFILDQEVRPDLRTTVFLRQSSLEDAIALILQTNKLERKVLNRNTILIYPNTPEKLKEYQELVVKGFYLANADVKQTQAMIKSLLKTKDMFVDEKLNLLVIRDTPEAIRLAEKLIAMHDLEEPEVMLEVEVLEVKRSRLLELGIQWPSQLTLTPLPVGAKPVLSDFKNLNSDRIGTTLPSTTVNLRREVGDANILANPRIRARNREKAKIMIGDKVPIVTTTTTTIAVSESIQYLDVGIKLEVEPNVYLQDEIAIKVGLEVSSLVREIRTPAGTLAYQIGSRSASTVLRLKDGETQVLAGLISDEDRTTANRVPGLGDLPVLGRLFSSQKDDWQKTEIILSITPRLIRNINRPDALRGEFWSGTEASLRTKPVTLKTTLTSQSATDNTQDVPEEKGRPLSNSQQANSNEGPSNITLSFQGPREVKVGEQFKLAVKMNADGGLRSLPFQLAYDLDAFEVLDIVEGPYFKQNDAKTSMSSNVDQKGGKVFASVVRTGIDGAKGENAVAILTMRAIAAKQSAEIKLLSATPVSVGEKNAIPRLPPAFAISVAN